MSEYMSDRMSVGGDHPEKVSELMQWLCQWKTWPWPHPACASRLEDIWRSWRDLHSPAAAAHRCISSEQVTPACSEWSACHMFRAASASGGKTQKSERNFRLNSKTINSGQHIVDHAMILLLTRRRSEQPKTADSYPPLLSCFHRVCAGFYSPLLFAPDLIDCEWQLSNIFKPWL